MPSFPLRTVTSLNGLWDFAFPGRIDLDAFSPASFPSETEKTPVPSAFDALPAHAGRRGAAVYRRRFTVPAGRRARLEFGAVSMWCRVWIDGVAVAEHACGYAPFTVDVPVRTDSSGERELVVLVDNRYDFARVPMHEEYFDFYQYGGLLRDVTLHLLPVASVEGGVFIDHVQTLVGEGYAEGRFQLRVHLSGKSIPASVALVTQIDDNEPRVAENIPVDADGVATLQLQAGAPRIWSPDTPHLHRLTVRLPDNGDALEIRFGLRRIEARSGKLWLNGQPLVLRGYNRHEWHPNTGPCTPTLQMVADIQLMKDLGCNFVRGSHYPQDQRFLDLCDEFGLLVWEENLGWGQREKTFASTKWRADHARALRAMVRASCNHPCVIIWGFLNEAGTNADYVRPVLEETTKTLRALDPSRLVSYASMYGKVDKHFDLADLIALNIYPGWYGCEGVEHPLDLIAPAMREFFASIDARGFADKPIMISEIGAEGLYGWRDAHNDFFTEEHQAEYIRRACEEALSNPRSSGIALWHFSDVRTYGGGWSLKRPRAFNNKGTFDEYRRPKAAARVVKEIFRQSSGAGK
ncbi:glycoside hydrolase family 2 protein [Geminisphaera colitermitum]|uniref:glycoside hydrolase family 2 protein n=1 Tax=Geminisphaera colitermitum TaxID=1148786 RepID=UPI000158D280|nr:glycoside hydrolase family 2 TIM barrel-domain containing protein [Geminisphaera colitermitum]